MGSRLCYTSLICILLFSLRGFTSCNGQDNKHLRVIESTAEGTDTTATWKDPLFFIEGQLCAWVRNIFQDSRGDLWFGTNHYGVMWYDGDTLRYIDEDEGLGPGRLNGMVEDQEGNVWFATWGGLSKYDGTSFTNSPVNIGPVNNDLQCIWLDGEGIIWLGTLEGAVRFDGREFSHFALPNIAVRDTTTHLSYNRVSSIFEDSNGTFWFGTDGFGICMYDPANGIFTHIIEEDGLPDDNIAGFMEDSDGNIWIGTMYGGISRYDGRSFHNITHDGLVTGAETYGMYEDRRGDIWFSAENVGVYRYSEGVFTLFDKEAGLETGGILCILEDKAGRFWLGGWGGLFRYDPSGKHSPVGKRFVSVTNDGPWE